MHANLILKNVCESTRQDMCSFSHRPSFISSEQEPIHKSALQNTNKKHDGLAASG